MKCPYCHEEIENGAKFCTNCGQPLPETAADGMSDLDAAVAQAMAAREDLEQNYGASRQETAGREDWEYSQSQEAPVQWYYVENSQSKGPYDETDIQAWIGQGKLDGDTFVWKDGMDAWQTLESTSLACYLPARSQSTYEDTFQSAENPVQTQETAYQEPPRYRQSGNETFGRQGLVNIPKRNIVLYVVLTICTCGLFGIVWLYQAAEDVNAILRSRNRPRLLSGLATVLLCWVTCGLYGFYFFYKAGSEINACSTPQIQLRDSSGPLLAALAVTFYVLDSYVVPLALLQSSLNQFSSRA